VVAGQDEKLWRKDRCGAWIGRQYHGKTESEYGWEIDHITSLDAGGRDELSNWQPLQWQNNRKKAEGSLDCAVTAKDVHNVSVSAV